MISRTSVCLIIASFFVSAWASAQDNEPPTVKDAEIGKTVNVHSCGSLWLAGQPKPDDLPQAKQKGIQRIINLRTDRELDWDEAGLVKASGMDFVHIPLGSPDSMTDKVFDQVRGLLRDSDKTATLLHCGSANRVGAVWLPYRVLDQGVDLDTALKEARLIGLRSKEFEAKARDYIRRNASPRQ